MPLSFERITLKRGTINTIELSFLPKAVPLVAPAVGVGMNREESPFLFAQTAESVNLRILGYDK
jgi:hypothetical protein